MTSLVPDIPRPPAPPPRRAPTTRVERALGWAYAILLSRPSVGSPRVWENSFEYFTLLLLACYALYRRWWCGDAIRNGDVILYAIGAFLLIVFWESTNAAYEKHLEADLGRDIFYGLSGSTMENNGDGTLVISLKSPRERPQGIPHLLLCYHSERDYVKVRRSTVMVAMRIYKSTSWMDPKIFLALAMVWVSAIPLCGGLTMYVVLKPTVTKLRAFLSPPVSPRAEDRPARMDARYRTIGTLTCLSLSFLAQVPLAPLIDRGEDFVKFAFLFSVVSSTFLALAIRFLEPGLNMDLFVTIAAIGGRHLGFLPLVECAPLGLALCIVPWLEDYYTAYLGHGSNDGSHHDGVESPRLGISHSSKGSAGGHLEIKNTLHMAPLFSLASMQTAFSLGGLFGLHHGAQGGGGRPGGLDLKSNAQQRREAIPVVSDQPIVVQGFVVSQDPVVPQDPVAPPDPVVGAKRGVIDLDSEVLHPRRRARRGVAGASSNREPIDWTKVVARSKRLGAERPGITNAICVEELVKEGVIGPNQRDRVARTMSANP